jgi:aminocarboxymuconate-semialdehyde decarboxylase
MSLRPLLIDAHSHIYTPRLVQLLKQRSQNPRIHGVPGKEKLAILPEEVDGGRTVGPQYWDRRVKLNFMNRHGIDASIISIANVCRADVRSKVI